jgi:multiple sugar transport system substrate-binding protein
MKKRLIPLLLCSLFLVTSCNNKKPTSSSSSSSSGEDLYQSYFGTKTAAEWKDHYKNIIDIDDNKNNVPDWQEKQMTIVFASDFYDDDDNLNTIFRNAKQWAAKYPNITLVRDQRFKKAVTNDSDEYVMEMLTVASQEGTMPDIFYVPLAAEVYDQDLILDLTPYLRSDEEARYIQDNALQYLITNDHKVTWGVSYMSVSQFPAVNVGLLKSKGINVPGYDWTYEQYEALRQQVANFTESGVCIFPGVIDYSIGGANYFDSIPNGWKGYNLSKQKFDFSSATKFGQWLSDEASEGNRGWHFYDLSSSEKESICGSSNWPWGDGFQAFDNMWMFSLSTDVNNLVRTRQLEIELYPMPKAPAGGTTSIIGYYDSFSLGYHLKDDRVKAQAVFELAKWLSYGEEGTEARWNMIDQDIEMYGETVDDWLAAGNDVADFPLVHPSTHLMDYIMGWPITNNPNVMANHPLVKGFPEDSYYSVFNFEAFKNPEFQRQLSGPIAYPRQIPAAARTVEHVNVWSDIKERMRLEGYTYAALAPEMDQLLNGYLAEYLIYYNKK